MKSISFAPVLMSNLYSLTQEFNWRGLIYPSYFFPYFTDISPNEEDLTKEVFAKVFQDLPGTSNLVAKIIDREALWKTRHMNAIRNKRIQLLGFDTCRRMTLEFMKTVARETRDRSPTLEIGHYDLPRGKSLHSRDGISASDLRESSAVNAQEIRTRMLKSLDLHLATKQKNYTAKLMRSAI